MAGEKKQKHETTSKPICCPQENFGVLVGSKFEIGANLTECWGLNMVPISIHKISKYLFKREFTVSKYIFKKSSVNQNAAGRV